MSTQITTPMPPAPEKFPNKYGVPSLLPNGKNNPIYRRLQYLANQERQKKNGRRLQRIYRNKMIKILGEKCANCGNTDSRVLQIDHINNDGAKERGRINGNRGGLSSAQRLKTVEINSSRFQLLCANCHMLKTGGYL